MNKKKEKKMFYLFFGPNTFFSQKTLLKRSKYYLQTLECKNRLPQNLDLLIVS